MIATLRRLGLAVLAVGTLCGTAQAEWTPYEPFPIGEVPLTISLKGWENGSGLRKAWRREWGRTSNGCAATDYYANVGRDRFWGVVDIREASFTCDWREDSIRVNVERANAFKDAKLDFGTYGAVDNGPAEYRYLMFTAEKNGSKAECIGFLSSWRTYFSNGFLCTNQGPLSIDGGKSFIKSLGFKDALSPVAGALE
jgi:hypothetical protein